MLVSEGGFRNDPSDTSNAYGEMPENATDLASARGCPVAIARVVTALAQTVRRSGRMHPRATHPNTYQLVAAVTTDEPLTTELDQLTLAIWFGTIRNNSVLRPWPHKLDAHGLGRPGSPVHGQARRGGDANHAWQFVLFVVPLCPAYAILSQQRTHAPPAKGTPMPDDQTARLPLAPAGGAR